MSKKAEIVETNKVENPVVDTSFIKADEYYKKLSVFSEAIVKKKLQDLAAAIQDAGEIVARKGINLVPGVLARPREFWPDGSCKSMTLSIRKPRSANKEKKEKSAEVKSE